MGCNCKNKNNLDNKNIEKVSTGPLGYFFKSLIFLVALLILIPVTIVYLTYYLFKIIVMGKNTFSLLNALVRLGKALKTEEEVDDEEDDEDDDDEDDIEYELTDVDLVDKELNESKK